MAHKLIRISRNLSNKLKKLQFEPPVAYVYDPLDYARAAWNRYLTEYARPQVNTVLLGMNPGPFGMAQTGVPFGEVSSVRDWLRIEETVHRPKREHPKRPVQGFACTRSEVSGARLWGWARQRYQTPARFFRRFFVYNYCPLVFLEESGRNRTPDKLPVAQRRSLFGSCDRVLRRVVCELRPRFVIGVGAFAEQRARVALEDMDLRIGRILHPSPANPKANRGWAEQIEIQLAEQGVSL